MKTLELKKTASVKINTPSCSCSSPCPIHKTETVKLEKNLKNIYKKA